MGSNQAFRYIGTQRDGIQLFYTEPAQLSLSVEAFSSYLKELEHIRTPWIWIVNCHGTTAEHYANLQFAHTLAKHLRESHSELLRNTWILSLNCWLRTLLTLFNASVLALSNERLEVLVHLQKSGVDKTTQDYLLRLLN